MAVKNRTEAIASVNSNMVPEIEAIELRSLFNNDILNSVTFDKDIIAAETPAGGAVTIDFATKDMATISTAVNLAVSFTNLENGSVKYFQVTKLAANVISFVGATNMVKNIAWINENTVILYRVINKNNALYVEALTPDMPLIYKKEIVNMGNIALQGEYTTRYIDLPGMNSITYDKIRNISFVVYQDSGNVDNTSSLQSGLNITISYSTGVPRIQYNTISGSTYDSMTFSGTGRNRGVITVEYV
jgi:hypothetical protein